MFGFRGPLEIIRENPARQEQYHLPLHYWGYSNIPPHGEVYSSYLLSIDVYILFINPILTK
jgi:hypothetical protein